MCVLLLVCLIARWFDRSFVSLGCCCFVVAWCFRVCRFVVLLACHCDDWLGRCYVVLLLSCLFVCVMFGAVACLFA